MRRTVKAKLRGWGEVRRRLQTRYGEIGWAGAPWPCFERFN